MSNLITMRSFLLTFSYLLVTFLPLISAQSIVPTSPSSQFPACAVNCAVLLQAQSFCIPPNVPTTNQLTYENCFCQSTLLAAIYSTPDAVCAGECTAESDRDLLQTWFKSFCQEVGQGINPLGGTTATVSPSSTVIVTITSYSTPAPGATNTGTGSASTSAASSNQSWIEGHWRWILMLGILIIGFGLLIWLLIWLKRRHRRKVDERRAAASGFPTDDEKRDGARSATPELWGPHQHMHYTKGWEYHHDPSITGGGVLASSSKRNRSSKRTPSHRQAQDHPQMAEYDGASRPPASRQQSSKGKSREVDEIFPVDSRGSHVRPEERSRSRSQRRRDPDSDLERNTADSEHQRRLREVRGSRRKKLTDQM